MYLSFKEFLSESVKNKHIYHIEEYMLFSGVAGARAAILALNNVKDALLGHSDKSYNVTTKWDGAPSIIAGKNPENGKFFVGTKGVFAKNPKLNYTEEDIDKNHPGGVGKKLKIALKYLRELDYDGVFQGDFLFDEEDLSEKTIDGKDYLIFTPNTITYAVDKSSQMAKEILSAKIGFVVHTVYIGKTIENMKSSFKFDIKKFGKSRNVWLTDVFIRDLSGTASFNKSEFKEYFELMTRAGKEFRRIDSHVLEHIKSDEEFSIIIASFINSLVRGGESIPTPAKLVQGLKRHISNKFEKEMQKLKTAGAKLERKKSIVKYTSYIDDHLVAFNAIFTLHNTLIQCKNIIISKLNKIASTRAFIELPSGDYKVTTGEGFVISDSSDNVVKLVDRLEFSFNNFNKVKNWAK